MARKKNPDAKIQQSIGGDIHRITVYMGLETKRKLLKRAASEGKTQSLIVAEAISAFLGS